jgi:hypothetical protein
LKIRERMKIRERARIMERVRIMGGPEARGSRHPESLNQGLRHAAGWKWR